MRYLLIKCVFGYKVIDINKGGLYRQERYVLDRDGLIIGTVVNEYSDPLHAISDLTNYLYNDLKTELRKEIKNGYYR